MDCIHDHQHISVFSFPCWLGKPAPFCPSCRVKSLDSQAWTPWRQMGVFGRSTSWPGCLSGRNVAAQINPLQLNLHYSRWVPKPSLISVLIMFGLLSSARWGLLWWWNTYLCFLRSFFSLKGRAQDGTADSKCCETTVYFIVPATGYPSILFCLWLSSGEWFDVQTKLDCSEEQDSVSYI